MEIFEWTPEVGLEVLDEDEFRLAECMVDKGLVTIDDHYAYLEDANGNVDYTNPQIQISSAKGLICNALAETGQTTTAFMLDNIINKKSTDENYILLKCSKYALRHSTPFGNCAGCIYKDDCIYYYAAYIFYLKNYGHEDELKRQRAQYEAHRTELESARRNPFNFKLPENLFYDLSDEHFEVAELLLKNNFVSLYPQIAANDENRMVYWEDSFLKHGDVSVYQDLKKIRCSILDGTFDTSVRNYYYIPDFSTEGSFHKAYQLEVLAAYIDYLKKTGAYPDYKIHRAEYRKNTQAKLRDYTEEHPQLEKIYKISESDAESSLYYIVEGERGVGKRELIQTIADYLNQNGKIHSSDYTCMTFEEAAIRLGYVEQSEYGTNDARNEYMVYDRFEDHKLYVLTDLKEFLAAVETTRDGDGSKYSHLIKILGRYQADTYIIVVGAKKYVDKFLRLSDSIAFTFGQNVVHMADLNTKRLFEAYRDKLSVPLRHDLMHQSDFEYEFAEYVRKYRRAMPLENQELAAYLANYTNLQKKLVLPPYATRDESAAEMLEQVIGMANVKKAVKEFELYAAFLQRAKQEGIAVPNSNLHMIFTGNPGTGKTMIARIIGQLLYDLGIIEENRVIEVESKDLKAGYIGQTATKTAELIDRAMGGVLFIDEAYSLGNDGFAKEAIATLIKAMEDYKDNLVVIFAGYEKEMHDFININPGISSRIGYIFRFEDYSAEELTQIYDAKVTHAGFTCEENAKNAVLDVCKHFSGKKNFGNGRFVDKLIQKTMFKLAEVSAQGGEIKNITVNEIPSIEEMVTTDVIEQVDYKAQLDKFIGLNGVKEQIETFAKYMEFQQKAKEQGAVIPAGNMHMIFVGNPGTGKTTIARIMVDMLYSIGFIKERKLVEVERKDIVAEYIGQTAQKTNDVIERALNGVLFIDEAYTLVTGTAQDYGSEAIATLIKAMEDHKDELIVVFAGYKDEMQNFVDANPGIASRIGYTFDFEDYNSDELTEMFVRKLANSGFTVTNGAAQRVREVSEEMKRKKNFGNGRFVDSLIQKTLMQHAEQEGADLLVITERDIPDEKKFATNMSLAGASEHRSLGFI